jgi:TRAP-type C4-dicarboxylate transport system substrate-binding protein
MNLAAWNRLSDAEKRIMLEAGARMEDVWYREYDRMAEAEVKELLAKGVTVSRLGATKEKLNEVWSEGLWDLAEKKSPNEAKELRAIAKAKGLTD